MRSLTLLGFSLAWISACVGCGTRPEPQAPARQLAAQLEAETVAIVRLVDDDGNDSEDGKPTSYCAGVFVSPSVIVTAEHCVVILGMTPDRLELHRAGADDDLPRWNPTGQRARYAMQGQLTNDGGGYWSGTVLADDPDDDLGAIQLDAEHPMHAYAQVSTGEIADGDRVEIVGHPIGYLWSYAEGYVSASRNDTRNPHERLFPTLQVAGPIAPGNSGGGAFDAFGRLVGVASYQNNSMHGMGFFVHRDAVARFLHTVGVL
jgi:S1-C subfamily serine protease